MLPLLPPLREHFDSLEDRLVLFARQGIQVEGWFKAETLLVLSRLLSEGTIEALDREVRFPEGRVDITFTYRGQLHLVEIKHWLVGHQREYEYDTDFYFTDRTSVGILPDVSKLARIHSLGAKWLMLFVTARPEPDVWDKGVSTFNSKFMPFHLAAHTSPADFPEAYFLGLLQVFKGTDA